MFLDEEKLIEDILIRYEESNSLMNMINFTELENQIGLMEKISNSLYNITRDKTYKYEDCCDLTVDNLCKDIYLLYFRGLLTTTDNPHIVENRYMNYYNLEFETIPRLIKTTTKFEFKKSVIGDNYKITAETIYENIKNLTFFKYNQILEGIKVNKSKLTTLQNSISRERYEFIINSFNMGKLKFIKSSEILKLLKDLEEYK